MTVFSPKIPDGMVDLMKTLAKNVLKEKPDNIYEYAATYCENLLKKRDGSLDKGYGKFRSYEKYCKFMETMELRRKNLHKQNEDTDSGVGSSNTDDETSKTKVIQNNPIRPEMKVNGVAVGTRKIKQVQPSETKKPKNYSVNPKLKAQGSIERDRRSRTLTNTEKLSPAQTSSRDTSKEVTSDALLKKNKSKPRKLSSKKPSENLIVIKEETSSDVAEVDENVKIANAANIIQRAARRFLIRKQKNRENMSIKEKEEAIIKETFAAIVIQKTYRSFINRKINNEIPDSNDAIKVIPSAPNFEDIDDNLKIAPSLEADTQSKTINEIKDKGIEILDDTTGMVAKVEMLNDTQTDIEAHNDKEDLTKNSVTVDDEVGSGTNVEVLSDTQKEIEENKDKELKDTMRESVNNELGSETNVESLMDIEAINGKGTQKSDFVDTNLESVTNVLEDPQKDKETIAEHESAVKHSAAPKDDETEKVFNVQINELKDNMNNEENVLSKFDEEHQVPANNQEEISIEKKVTSLVATAPTLINDNNKSEKYVSVGDLNEATEYELAETVILSDDTKIDIELDIPGADESKNISAIDNNSVGKFIVSKILHFYYIRLYFLYSSCCVKKYIIMNPKFKM